MVDFKKYCGPVGKQALEELQNTVKKDREMYQMKVKKLMTEFDNGRLPDTDFINSFLPRVSDKIKLDVIPLSAREKEVIDDLFDKY